MENEDGRKIETNGSGRKLFDYDGRILGEDIDNDGYVEFTISRYDGSEYDKVCKIKCKLEKKED